MQAWFELEKSRFVKKKSSKEKSRLIFFGK